MHPIKQLQQAIIPLVKTMYDHDFSADDLPLTPTRKEFSGDYTLVTFALTRAAKTSPDQIATDIGDRLLQECPTVVSGYNVIKGFLNIDIQTALWMDYLEVLSSNPLPAFERLDEGVLVEYASPNTNKPLHLGHVRNILLGWSMSQILDRAGYDVVRVQVVNDRGIAICKSMLAWQKFGEGATPESSGIKGDHLVGDFYVRFEEMFKAEYAAWQLTTAAAELLNAARGKGDPGKPPVTEEVFFKNYKNTYFNEASTLGAEAREMLIKWEANDPEIRALWSTMNGWVYAGFQQTYDALGVTFDKSYYESQTYLLGRDLVDKGLETKAFYRQEDGSVWIDLTDEGLDKKILLRSNGTSVYITQDLGTAEDRYRDFEAKRMVYVVADEQNYHFQVLFAILKRLEAPYADGLVHLSYGMVELPTGRMKSREGTVVDADDLIEEVIKEAKAGAVERGESDDMSTAELAEIYRKVGLAALKYHIIKVNPKRKMIFDPKESVDLQGHTGPYIQNAYVRIQSIFRKAGQPTAGMSLAGYPLAQGEKELILLLSDYPAYIQQAADQFDPSHVANYAYTIAKAYHKFYHEFSVLRAESELAREVRLHISSVTAQILQDAMHLLGMEMPERM